VWRHFPILIIVVITTASPLAAQSQSSARPWSADINPHVGYRTNTNFDTETDVLGVTPRLVLDSNSSFGMAFGVRFFDENEFSMCRVLRY
jgi:hypothetical protein